MKLINIKTGLELEAEISEVELSDLNLLKSSKQFSFNWSEETQSDLYKIRLINDNEILGLLALVDYPKEQRVFIHLIEIAEKHIGKDKQIDKIAGCLIAFAISLAFEKGYNGFTSLIPKTELINLYQNKYGFQPLGKHLYIDGKAAISLINKYL